MVLCAAMARAHGERHRRGAATGNPGRAPRCAALTCGAGARAVKIRVFLRCGIWYRGRLSTNAQSMPRHLPTVLSFCLPAARPVGGLAAAAFPVGPAGAE